MSEFLSKGNNIYYKIISGVFAYMFSLENISDLFPKKQTLGIVEALFMLSCSFPCVKRDVCI